MERTADTGAYGLRVEGKRLSGCGRGDATCDVGEQRIMAGECRSAEVGGYTGEKRASLPNMI